MRYDACTLTALALLTTGIAAAQDPGGKAGAPDFTLLPPCPGIEVTAERAKVTLARTTVATVAKGRRFGVREQKADAFEIQVFSGKTLRYGWIAATDVRALADADVDLAAEALAIAKELTPTADVAALQAQVDALTAKVTKAAEGANAPLAKARAVQRVLFRQERFAYQKAAHPMDGVLEQKRGNCLSLSLLYLAVSRELDLPLRGVSVPKHAFLRCEDAAKPFWIEPSMGGILVSDSYVRGRYGGKGKTPPKLLSHLELIGLVLSQTANDLALKGDRKRACTLFARAAELAPRNGENYNNWGSCLLTLDRNPQAAAMLARAVECDPSNLGARSSWAVALSKMGQTRSAAAQFARITEIDPRHGDAWFNWGTTLLRMGQTGEAREKFAKAVALKPQLKPYVDDMLRQSPGQFDNRTWEPSVPR